MWGGWCKVSDGFSVLRQEWGWAGVWAEEQERLGQAEGLGVGTTLHSWSPGCGGGQVGRRRVTEVGATVTGSCVLGQGVSLLRPQADLHFISFYLFFWAMLDLKSRAPVAWNSLVVTRGLRRRRSTATTSGRNCPLAV